MLAAATSCFEILFVPFRFVPFHCLRLRFGSTNNKLRKQNYTFIYIYLEWSPIALAKNSMINKNQQQKPQNFLAKFVFMYSTAHSKTVCSISSGISEVGIITNRTFQCTEHAFRVYI